MQIHELNNFTGTLGAGAYLAVDDGNDTGKLSTQQLLAATEARIDNIIAGPAPSAEEIVDARLGDDGVTYPSLGDAIRDQVGDLKSDLSKKTVNLAVSPTGRFTANDSGVISPYNGTTAVGLAKAVPCIGEQAYMFAFFGIGWVDGQGFPKIYVTWYDENKTFISQVSNTRAVSNGMACWTSTSPNNAKYMYCHIYGGGGISVNTKIQIRTGTTAPTRYFPPYSADDIDAITMNGSLTSVNDLNNVTDVGYYILNASSSPSNIPSGVTAAVLFVLPADDADYPHIVQILYDTNAAQTIYSRAKGGYSGATWSSWTKKLIYSTGGSLNSTADLNDYRSGEGYYTTPYNNLPQNAPITTGQGLVFVYSDDSTKSYPFVVQVFIDIYNAEVYTRTIPGYSGATWGAWNKKKDITYNESQNSTSFDNYAEPSASTASVSGDRVRVLSYNVAHYNNDSATYIDEVHEKLINFKKMLMFVGADILSIPEDDEYIDSGDTKDSVAWLYKPIYPFKVGGGACCVHSKTTLQNTDNITLPSGNVVRKGAISVGNKTLTMYSAHLPVSSEEDRATALAELFAKIATDNPTYYVIAGDMNCFEEGEHETFKATCESHGCTLANGGYLGWLSTHKNNLPIDNIIVSSNIVIENTEVLGNWFGSLYSDHYPIFSDLVLL